MGLFHHDRVEGEAPASPEGAPVLAATDSPTAGSEVAPVVTESHDEREAAVTPAAPVAEAGDPIDLRDAPISMPADTTEGEHPVSTGPASVGTEIDPTNLGSEISPDITPASTDAAPVITTPEVQTDNDVLTLLSGVEDDYKALGDKINDLRNKLGNNFDNTGTPDITKTDQGVSEPALERLADDNADNAAPAIPDKSEFGTTSSDLPEPPTVPPAEAAMSIPSGGEEDATVAPPPATPMFSAAPEQNPGEHQEAA